LSFGDNTGAWRWAIAATVIGIAFGAAYLLFVVGCEDQPSTPGGGNSANSPGSPFVGGVSDGKYAGSQPQNSNNPNSVSQYGVACVQVSQ